MLNKDLLSVHVHLMYLEPSKYILDLLSEVWDDKIYLSLIEGNKHNPTILSYAKQRFPSILVKYVANKGTDQYGFMHSFKINNEETPWIMYIHDKHLSKLDWLDQTLLPILHSETINPLLLDDNNGIISSGYHKWVMRVENEEELTAKSKYMPFNMKHCLVRVRHTLAWLRELQYILVQKTGFIDTDNINPKFTAGNIFIARRNVVNMAMSCIHENFFEDHYRPDGDVAHAMERFYYYVATCLKYDIKFIEITEDK